MESIAETIASIGASDEIIPKVNTGSKNTRVMRFSYSPIVYRPRYAAISPGENAPHLTLPESHDRAQLQARW